jgi:hypothetical protein
MRPVASPAACLLPIARCIASVWLYDASESSLHVPWPSNCVLCAACPSVPAVRVLAVCPSVPAVRVLAVHRKAVWFGCERRCPILPKADLSRFLALRRWLRVGRLLSSMLPRFKSVVEPKKAQVEEAAGPNKG